MREYVSGLLAMIETASEYVFDNDRTAYWVLGFIFAAMATLVTINII